MQFITICGRLSADAETRQAGDGTVTSFNMAVDQGFGDKKQTNWFRVSVWGKKGAGAAPYLLKSGQVTVVGELEIGTYNDKPQYNVRATDFTLPAKGSGGDAGRGENRSESGRNAGSGGDSQRGNGGPSRRAAFDDDLEEDLVPFMRSDGIW